VEGQSKLASLSELTIDRQFQIVPVKELSIPSMKQLPMFNPQSRINNRQLA
jgi:hypothetical protein